MTPALPPSREQLAAMASGLERYAQWCGGVHDQGCPEDDTCSCSCKSTNDAVNGAVRFLRDLSSPSAPAAETPTEEQARGHDRTRGPAMIDPRDPLLYHPAPTKERP